MPLYLTHHPWPGGTMSKEDALALMRATRATWQERAFRYLGYLGTPQNGEGWSLVSAPSREALAHLLITEHIPYLTITEVWQVAEEELREGHDELRQPRTAAAR